MSAILCQELTNDTLQQRSRGQYIGNMHTDDVTTSQHVQRPHTWVTITKTRQRFAPEHIQHSKESLAGVPNRSRRHVRMRDLERAHTCTRVTAATYLENHLFASQDRVDV